MIVEIALAAENDLADGYWFYERQHQGLGNYFRVNLVADIESLALTGGIHEIELGFHRAMSKRFPYGIYYLSDAHRVIVAAVLDLRREPLWIRSHLEAR
jgi:plasmid stabilization system protein ParE